MRVLSEKSAASFIRDEDSAEFEYDGAWVTVSFGFGSELLACDWVYAADFAARATASGPRRTTSYTSTGPSSPFIAIGPSARNSK